MEKINIEKKRQKDIQMGTMLHVYNGLRRRRELSKGSCAVRLVPCIWKYIKLLSSIMIPGNYFKKISSEYTRKENIFI